MSDAQPAPRQSTCSARPDHCSGPFVFAILCVPILGATLLSRFGLPPFAQLGIGIALPLTAFALALGAIGDCVRLEPRRLALYCAMLAVLVLPQLLRAGRFSAFSVLMLAAVHLPYVFVVRGGHERVAQVLGFVLDIAALLACCAIAQYFLQFVLPAAPLFPIDNFVPRDFVVQGFNGQSVIRYGSDVYRANGVFMLEPSFLTQLLAVAIVAEAIVSRRMWRLALYAGGIVVAHAGTGLLILAICLPLLIVAYRRWNLLLLCAACLVVFWIAADVLNVGSIANRIHEFSDPHSSGYARFVGGFHLFGQMLWPEPARAYFGYGAGSFMEHAHLFQREAADMPLTKMVFEFGLVGAAVYFGFLAACLFSAPLPWVIGLSIALTFLLNGMYVPFSHGLALSLLALTSLPRATGPMPSSQPRALPA